MSAFFAAKATVDDVIGLIVEIERDGKPFSQREADLLGKMLWHMNSAALNQRYDMAERDAVGLAEQEEEADGYAFSTPHPSMMQQLKSAHCFRWQCSEGNVPEWSLFKRLEAIIEEADKRYAGGEPYGHPDWYAAEWGRAA